MKKNKACQNSIVLHAGKQGARSAKIGGLAPVFEKSFTEFWTISKLIKCKITVHRVTVNVWTLNIVNQLPELTAFTAEHNIDVKMHTRT